MMTGLLGFWKKMHSAKARDPETGDPFDAAAWLEKGLADFDEAVRPTFGLVQVRRDMVDLLARAEAENRMTPAEREATWAAFDAEIARRFGELGNGSTTTADVTPATTVSRPVDREAAAMDAALSVFDTTIDGSQERADFLANRATGILSMFLDEQGIKGPERKQIEQKVRHAIAEEARNCVFPS